MIAFRPSPYEVRLRLARKLITSFAEQEKIAKQQASDDKLRAWGKELSLNTGYAGTSGS